MSPKLSPKFEAVVRNRLSKLLRGTGTDIVVDEVDSVDDEGVLLVSFHLEGTWASPAGFSFPFHQEDSIDDNLDAVRDLVSRNWDRAHIAPPVADRPWNTAFAK